MIIGYDTPIGYHSKTLIKIISIMTKLGLDTSTEITMIKLENIEVIVDQMAHEFPAVCSLVINSLFITLFIINGLPTDE